METSLLALVTLEPPTHSFFSLTKISTLYAVTPTRECKDPQFLNKCKIFTPEHYELWVLTFEWDFRCYPLTAMKCDAMHCMFFFSSLKKHFKASTLYFCRVKNWYFRFPVIIYRRMQLHNWDRVSIKQSYAHTERTNVRKETDYI